MIKRLFAGFAKGMMVGGAIGAGLQLGLEWAPVAGLLGFLLAMGTAATAGVVAGKAPWRQDTWIEGALKAVGGLMAGALAYWLASTFAAAEVAIAIRPVPAGTPWTSQPLLVLPMIASLYGMLIELDNTDSPPASKPGGKASRMVSQVEEIEDAVIVSEEQRGRR